MLQCTIHADVNHPHGFAIQAVNLERCRKPQDSHDLRTGRSHTNGRTGPTRPDNGVSFRLSARPFRPTGFSGYVLRR
jgi:hypothetical protein